MSKQVQAHLQGCALDGQLDALLQDALACADKADLLRKELNDALAQVQRVERENEGLKRMLAEMRELCQTLTARLKEHEEMCVQMDTTKIRLLQAERHAHEMVATERQAAHRIRTLEANVNTVQAQKDQMSRLNDQLMRQKGTMEEKLRESKTTTVPQGAQHQDIIFYKNKCIELQQENALLRQASKTARPTGVQAECHPNVKMNSGVSQSRKQKRV